MKEFNRNNVNALMKDMLAALKSVEEKHNVKFSDKGGRFGTLTATLKIEANVETDAGFETEEMRTLKRILRSYGIDTEQTHTFTANGRKVRLVGYKAKNRKYPFIAEDVSTGQRFKYPSQFVLARLAAH